MIFHPLTVSRLDHLTEDAVAVTLDVPSSLRETFRHVPGQHLTFRHTPADGAELRRTYSICSPASSPDEAGPDRLTVGVRHIDGGVFSAHVVKELKAGDTLDALPPAGRFTLPPVPGRYAAVVGGSGVTPVLSMVATLLARAPEARFTVLRCDRSSASTMFLEEFADLKDRHPDRLQLAYAFSREEQQAGLATGRMDADRLGVLLPALLGPGMSDVAGWYLCGPLGLVEAAHEALRAVGVDRRRVHTELFHADAAPVGEPRVDAAAPAGSRVTATLDGRSGTWPMEPGETLLETVLRNRADAPYACKGGVCGTCRVQLVRGEVGMDRNYALEPEEVAGGYVLACQSRPRTAEVAIDFDA